jgi:hypothetical protein
LINLVAFDAQERRAEDLLGFRVDQHVHEALGFATLPGTADSAHHHLANERLAPRGSDLSFGLPDPAQRRVDIEGIGRNAVGHAAWIVVEQVGRDDFVPEFGERPHGTRSLATCQSQDKRGNKQQEKNEEQNLGDFDSAGRNASKAEQRGDQRDDKKYDGIMQRLLSFH